MSRVPLDEESGLRLLLSASEEPEGPLPREAARKRDALAATASALVKAERFGDTSALRGILAFEYRGFDPWGQPQDRDAVLAAHQSRRVRIDEMTVTDQHVRDLGDAGFVTGLSAMKGVVGTERFELRLRFLDVYVYRNGVWQLVSSLATTVKMPPE